MAEGTLTYLKPVVYKGDGLGVVSAYNSLAPAMQHGDYWDTTDDKKLIELKKTIKDHYIRFQNYHCAYCRQQIVVTHNAAWDTDHIIAKDLHPKYLFEPRNLCVSCRDCNLNKSNKNVLKRRDRKTFAAKPSDYIFCHPHFHDYSAHIRIVKEAMLYLPRTPEGIKLIEICGLLRFVLRFAGYDYDDGDVGGKMVRFATELQNAESPTERVVIMNIMRTLLDENLRAAALAALEAIDGGSS